MTFIRLPKECTNYFYFEIFSQNLPCLTKSNRCFLSFLKDKKYLDKPYRNMFYYSLEVVFQEVPGEISLSFSICGCQLRCEGCHSPFLWKKGNGTLLTVENYRNILEQYRPYASCVLFMGGEWHEKELVQFLKIAKSKYFKTCLYTGEETVCPEILEQLDWLKTGKWNPKLGGLDSPNTNQIFKDIKTNTIHNHLFSKS